MGSEKALSDEIIREAQRRAERRLKRAQREAQKTLTEARAQAEDLAEKTLEAARKRADQLAQAILATVPQEAQRERLHAIETHLASLFDEALRRLRDKASYDYPAVLLALAAQAIEAMAAQEVVLEVAEEDRPLLDEGWLGRLRERLGREVMVSVETAQGIGGGLVVRSADGRLLYDNSFGARLRRLRPDLRRQLARKLYPPEEASAQARHTPPEPHR